MHIHKFQIKNFKSIKDITLYFNKDLNILTGVNNSGKTTVLEALALWNECFYKLLNRAKRGVKGRYEAGDYVLGPSNNKYFNFDDINSVRSPNFEDMFRNLDKKNKIILSATIENEFGDSIKIAFKIGDSGGKYLIELDGFGNFDFNKFNKFFKSFPEPTEVFYASPVAAIKGVENFVTEPQIKDSIRKRESSEVIRNRIYKLYHTDRFSKFQNDLSFILYNETSAKLKITNTNDINKDLRVIINFKIQKNEVEKDIALLGSGTLQAIEILLNVYQQTSERKDLIFVLLDEPDSHIHRDIQKRLLSVLLVFAKEHQIFITTHNEAMIRSTPLQNLFHLDGSVDGEIKNMYLKDLEKIGIPRYKGMYPSQYTPVIKSIGYDSGLDFINALEADKIIFVEGDDDARVIYNLLQEYPSNHNRKFMFWVLGGVSAIFSKINSYKLFFSDIKNGKSLWDKSYLVFDKDAMTDAHIDIVSQQINDKLNLPNHCIRAYTMESVLFSDLAILEKLLTKYLVEVKNIDNLLIVDLGKTLSNEYQKMKDILNVRYSKDEVDKQYKGYIGQYSEKTKSMFDSRTSLIEDDAVKLVRELEEYYNDIISKEHFYKLMTKKDVESVINAVILNLNASIDIETDFYEFIKISDKSTWFSEWDFLKNI
jgi:predicted ATP-dependent endonuclease of OLD family